MCLNSFICLRNLNTTQEAIKALEAFYICCLQRILRVTLQDMKIYNKILERRSCESIEAQIAKRSLRWVVHVIRMQDNRLPKKILFAELAQDRGWGLTGDFWFIYSLPGGAAVPQGRIGALDRHLLDLTLLDLGDELAVCGSGLVVPVRADQPLGNEHQQDHDQDRKGRALEEPVHRTPCDRCRTAGRSGS